MNFNAEFNAELLEMLRPYEFIFIDTNFIDLSVPGSSICHKLYDLRCISDFYSVEPDLLKFNENIKWRLENIVMDDRVFTVPEIAVEIKDFKRNLDEFKYRYTELLSFLLKAIRHEKTLRSSLRHNGLLHKRGLIEDLIDSVKMDVEENHINPHNKPMMLSYLDKTIKTTEMVLDNLKMYTEKSGELIQNLKSAKGADHSLVRAAYGCFLEDQNRKIVIVSDDEHINIIAYINSIFCCFDVINPIKEYLKQNNSKDNMIYPQYPCSALAS